MKIDGETLNVYYQVKKEHSEKAMCYESNHMTLWKKQNYRDRKMINLCQGLGSGEEWIGHKGLLG